MSPILDGGGGGLSPKIVVSNPGQPVIGKITKAYVTLGEVGPQGPPGPAGSADPSVNNVWTVPQIWGTDVRKYGSVTGSAAVNTATLNAALADHANWSRLLLPPGIIEINDDLVLPETSGKIVQGQGCNATYSPGVGGTRIVQTVAAKNILRIDGESRALKFRDFSLAYDSQETTDGKAAVLFNIPNTAGANQHDIEFSDVTVELADRAFDCPLIALGSNSIWNMSFNRVRIWTTNRTAIRLKGQGNPSNTFSQIFVSNIPGGPTPVGPAIDVWNGEFTFDGLDIEGWHNLAYYGFGARTTIRGLHVEHHVFSGVVGDGDGNQSIVRSDEGPLSVWGQIAMDQSSPGSLMTSYAAVFRAMGTKASVAIDDFWIDFPSALSGSVALLDGDNLALSKIGPSLVQVGTKTIDILGTGYTFWPAAGFPVRQGDTGWTTATLLNSWTPIGSPYQDPRYRRVNGMVIVQGGFVSHAGATTDAIFTLPVGFRPSGDTIRSPSNGFGAAMQVGSNGQVVPASSDTAANGYFVFPADL